MQLIEKRVSDNSISYTKCRCCGQTIEVKTIDDMLERAYKIIDEDTKISQLLINLKLNKRTVGILQEYTRSKMLSAPYSSFLRDYRCVQSSESNIYLGFNENFTVLEVIEISPQIFRNNSIRGFSAQFNSFTNDEKTQFLVNTFSKFNPKLRGISSYIEVKYIKEMINTEIVLKKTNKELDHNRAFALYPNSDDYPYFRFNINHDTEDGRLENIRLHLCNTKAINEPISKWLHQPLISMFPDYGGVYLWFDGAAGCLEDIEGYNLKNSELAQRLEDWQATFEDSWSRTDMDWEQFNKVGIELFNELKNIIKKYYILTYSKSFEEIYGTHAEKE